MNSRFFVILALCLLPGASALAQSSPGIAIVSPEPDALLQNAATTVVLRFPAGQAATLAVNGVKASPSLIGRTEKDSVTGLETQTWYGVVLADGENMLTADAGGAEATRHVEVQSKLAKLTLRALGSRLPANGRATLTLTGTALDSKNRPMLHSTLVTLTAGAGEFAGTDADLDQPGFQVKAVSGQFSAVLRSGVLARTVPIRASAEGASDAFTQIEFTTDLRPSVATGIVDFRLGSRRSDYDRPIQDFVSPDVSSGTALEGRTSLFATGKLGDYLFLGAYNSDHALNQTANGPSSLGRDTQTSDNPYPIYGDSSTAAALAQSRDNLALRLEHNQNYFLWGDYGTEEFAGPSQQLTAITRAFHALKGSFQTGAVQTTGFYGDNVQGFQRDAVAPDGTSGLYFLSHRPLVYGSEAVFFEMEDINRPGTVLERTAEERGTDYDIDYDRGTLFFHQPVLRTDVGPDGQALVRRIVVTYQFETGGGGTSVYGGRMQYHLDGGGAGGGHTLGVTYLRQNQGQQSFDLSGIDTRLPMGRFGAVTAEYGHSSGSTDALGTVSGAAYRFNADVTLGRGTALTAYGKHTDTGYSNDATESYVPGQTRYGGEVAAALTPTTRLRVQADHEDNQGIAPQPAGTLTGLLLPGSAPAAGTPVDNSLQTISVNVAQQVRRAQVSVGLIDRRRTDRIAGSGLSGNSDQVETRLEAPLKKNLSLQAQNDTSLSGTDVVYTDRTLVGIAWKPKPDVDVRLSQQWYGRGQYDGHSVTSLEAGAEHKDRNGTQMSERMTLTGGASGVALQQSLGLGKRWTLAPGLAANVGYEHISGAFFGRTGAGNQYAQPYAVGQSASSLGVAGGGSESVGLEYTRPKDFKASARYETRTSGGGTNTVVTGAAAGKLSEALTALAAYAEASSSNQLLSALGRTSTLRLGLAYRDPLRDSFNGLVHFESRRNPSVIPDTILVGSGAGSRETLFAAEGIYAPEWQWEFYGKLARRDSAAFLASDYTGSSRIDLAQTRVTYRFRQNMDAVGDLRWIGEHEAGYSSRGVVMELGYYATPDLRLGLGYSFGRVGDRDFTGSLSSGGVFLRLTAKLNQIGGGFGIQRGALDDNGAPVPAGFRPAPTGNASAPLSLPPAEGTSIGKAHD